MARWLASAVFAACVAVAGTAAEPVNWQIELSIRRPGLNSTLRIDKDGNAHILGLPEAAP
jgi:hypothetical protein